MFRIKSHCIKTSAFWPGVCSLSSCAAPSSQAAPRVNALFRSREPPRLPHTAPYCTAPVEMRLYSALFHIFKILLDLAPLGFHTLKPHIRTKDAKMKQNSAPGSFISREQQKGKAVKESAGTLFHIHLMETTDLASEQGHWNGLWMRSSYGLRLAPSGLHRDHRRTSKPARNQDSGVKTAKAESGLNVEQRRGLDHGAGLIWLC